MDDDFFGDIFTQNEVIEIAETNSSSIVCSTPIDFAFKPHLTSMVKQPVSNKVSTAQNNLANLPSFLRGSDNDDIDDIDFISDLPDWTSLKNKNQTKQITDKSENFSVDRNQLSLSQYENNECVTKPVIKLQNPSPTLDKSFVPNVAAKKLSESNLSDSRNTTRIAKRSSYEIRVCKDSSDSSIHFVESDGNQTDSILNTNKRKRKFPGPAGLLPQLPAEQIRRLSQLVKLKKNEDSSDPVNLEPQELTNSQVDESEFNRGPWLQALHDLHLNDVSKKSPLSKYNISWLLRKVNLKQLPNSKMPLLITTIKLINFKGTVASTILKDNTGEITGTIHQITDEYFSILKPGTVLILQQVSVISLLKKKHYLNITPTNIVSIYHTQEDNSVDCLRLEKGDIKEHLINIAKQSEFVTTVNQTKFLPILNSKINQVQKTPRPINVQNLYNVKQSKSTAGNLEKRNSPTLSPPKSNNLTIGETMNMMKL